MELLLGVVLTLNMLCIIGLAWLQYQIIILHRNEKKICESIMHVTAELSKLKLTASIKKPNHGIKGFRAQ